MEKGRAKNIIDNMYNTIESATSVPLSTGKVMVDRDELLLMLRSLEDAIDTELKNYREVTDRKGKILNDAKAEAQEIIEEAEKSASRIRVSKAVGRSGRLINEDLSGADKEALRTAGDIYAASLIVTDEMLTEVNDVLERAQEEVIKQYENMMKIIDEKTAQVEKNKAELMSSLKEMSKEERYEHILELGQLLSNELYRERRKAMEAEAAVKRVHISAGHIDDYGRKTDVRTTEIDRSKKTGDEH